MPETPEAHKEIVEIKKEVREIRQTQDAQIHLDRQRLETHLFSSLQNDVDMMRILLVIDGTKSAKDLEKECGLYPMKCWRKLDKLQKEGIVTRLDDTKKGSPIYVKARWYTVLRLDEKVRKKLESPSPRSQLNTEQGHVNSQQQS